MPRRKVVSTEISLRQEKNISLIAVQNEYDNIGKDTGSVKRDGQGIQESRKKRNVTSIVIASPLQSGGDVVQSVSLPKNRGRNTSTIKGSRNAKKKTLTEKNKEENNASEIKRTRAAVSKKKEKNEGLSPIVMNIESSHETSPAGSSTKTPQRKISSTKRLPNANKKIFLTETNNSLINGKDKSVKNKKLFTARSRMKGKKDLSLNSTPNSSRKTKTETPHSANKKVLLNATKKDKSKKKDKNAIKKNPLTRNSVEKEMSSSSLAGNPFPSTATLSSVKAKKEPLVKKIKAALILPKSKKGTGSSVQKRKSCTQRYKKEEKNGLLSDLTLKTFTTAPPSKNSVIVDIKLKSQQNSRKRKLSSEQRFTEGNKKRNSLSKKKLHSLSGDEKIVKELMEELVLRSAINIPLRRKNIITSAAVSLKNAQNIYQEGHETCSVDSKSANRKYFVYSSENVPKYANKTTSTSSSINVEMVYGGICEKRGIESESPSTDVAVSSAKDSPFLSKNETELGINVYLNLGSDNEEVPIIICAICLDLEEFSDFLTLSCNHVFHSFCLQTWYQVKKTCPVCNPDITIMEPFNDMYGYAYDNVIIEEVELQYANEVIKNELRKFSDTNDFQNQCAICKETSMFCDFDYLNDRYPDFKRMLCGHNVHIACAGILLEDCPICITNKSVENDCMYKFYEEIKCVICLDTEENTDFEYIPCCHSFHHQCIRTWFNLRRGEICPVCMANSSDNIIQDESLYGFFEDVKCAICLDIEESSDFTRLSCRHSVHTMCKQASSEGKIYCPICMKNVSVDNLEEDVRCIICVDTEEYNDFEFLPCAHSFHVVCIQSWLKNGKSCPTCNTPILYATNTTENVRYACY